MNISVKPDQLSRREERRSETRERLLRAAVAEFHELGFERATMDGVARRIGASKRTIYRHFADKQDLYKAVIRTLSRHLERPWPNLEDASRSYRERLHDAALWIDTQCRDPLRQSVLRNVIAQQQVFPEMARLTQDRGFSRDGSFGPLILLFDKMIEDGEIWFDDAIDAAIMFASLAYGGLRSLLLGPEDLPDSERWARQTVALFLDGAMAAGPRGENKAATSSLPTETEGQDPA